MNLPLQMKIGVAVFCLLAIAAAFAWPSGTRSRGSHSMTPEQIRAVAAVESLFPSWVKTERKTGFFGRWKEGRLDGRPVGFIASPVNVKIIAGEINPDREHWAILYMTRVPEGESLPPAGSPRRLDSHLGPDGGEVAQRYILNATGRKEGYRELVLPQIRSGLSKLSPRVKEAAFLQEALATARGVELWLSAEGLTSQELLEHAKIAVSMLKAWEAAAPQPSMKP